MKRILLTACLAVSIASPSVAMQPLHENPTVVNGFYTLGLADELRKNCDDLSPRWLRAYNYLKALEKFARKSGYSDAQIEELTKNRAEKEKLRVRIRADLKKRGASPENPEGYCTVGREEIAKGSAAGRLLRAN
ncbi:MAG: DUF5333 domain-containing protein [Boseongicola sp.]|nr:DUF5333 domain-containing protein [Boseongicola sp.]MDD9976714.1 DUF5333 domain-containing protein [Boseongicola sp.]